MMTKTAAIKGGVSLMDIYGQAKTRPVSDPYEIWVADDWEWRVLKKYQTTANEAKNQYSRWFCAVRSPLTHGTWEYGDRESGGY
jgi:hypothetical protein